MVALFLMAAPALAVDIAISPLTEKHLGLSCPEAYGSSIAFWGALGCDLKHTAYIPLSPFVSGRTITALTVCYLTEFTAGSYSTGVKLELIESLEPGKDVSLWSDAAVRVANPAVCEVIPMSVTPTGSPVLKISTDQFDPIENTIIGQIWISVTK